MLYIITICCMNILAVEIRVGYEMEEYEITESGGALNVCAVIYNAQSRGAPRDFDLAVSTIDNTAGDAPLFHNYFTLLELYLLPLERTVAKGYGYSRKDHEATLLL